MKLYYSPGTCSLAPHIVMREAGLSFDLERVDLATHTTSRGEDYFGINGKGQVPLLQLDNGEILTEGAVIAQFIADQAGSERLIPPHTDTARYRVAEWQNFISTELHKGYGPLFKPDINDEAKAVMRTALRKKYEWLDGQMTPGRYLCGDHFSVADAYLFVVTRWSKLVGLDLSDLDNIQSFMRRAGQRPAVQTALRVEGMAA
ncbi:MAG: glutathione transferase GstA [Gammaproteobacteria bacterium]